jgi:F-type H+-transporting ATPase subunit alpha
MKMHQEDLVVLIEQALKGHQNHQFEESGFVLHGGDGRCAVYGLREVLYGELVTFDSGNRGIVMNLDRETVDIFLLESHSPVSEGDIVRRTGTVLTIGVGSELLGRVVTALGNPVDARGAIAAEERRPLESRIPGIVERSPVNQSLETGIMAIDTLVPIGRGQRELIIGSRNTGKTSIVVDTIVHQKTQNVICIYASVGQREANLARVVRHLEEREALSYTVLVTANAGESALNRYLAPYAAATIAEYFRDQGHDVLVIYDDLTNHADAYREMSLLMRRSPGREAYPGDIFYLHSRLLERAGKLEKGGSITALPIVQIQGDDITAYIPTNLISITDGQIFLDTKLFNTGIRPAVNSELSVSRVGGAAQTKAIKRVTRALRLELAQYQELLGFAQFGTELDAVSQKRLSRGARVVELLKQQEGVSYTFVDQTLRLFLLKEDFLDELPVADVAHVADQFISYIQLVYGDLYHTILDRGDIDRELYEQVRHRAVEFMAVLIPQSTLL